MYMKRMVEIGQVSNGYVIECRVPIKPKKKKESKDVIEGYPGSSEKQFIADDIEGVIDIIQKLMPMLDDKFTSEEQFDAAFDKAAE